MSHVLLSPAVSQVSSRPSGAAGGARVPVALFLATQWLRRHQAARNNPLNTHAKTRKNVEKKGWFEHMGTRFSNGTPKNWMMVPFLWLIWRWHPIFEPQVATKCIPWQVAPRGCSAAPVLRPWRSLASALMSRNGHWRCRLCFENHMTIYLWYPIFVSPDVKP